MTARRVAAAIRKEFRQFFRDPVLLVLVLFLYTVDVVICTAALSFDLNNEPVGVLDLDRSGASKAFAERFDRSSTFQVRHYPANEREAKRLLDGGDARLVLVLPRRYGEDLARDGAAGVQILADGANSLIALTAIGQAQRLTVAATEELFRERMTAPQGPWIDNRLRVWYNPGLEFAFSVMISMIGLAAFIVGVILPTAGIVKEKEHGTMEQLLISPLRPVELLFAKIAPPMVVGLLALVPSVLIAFAFGVPLRGSVFTLAVFSGAFLLGAVSIGVVIASAVRTLQQALFVVLFVLFPVAFLSGTITPVESMPPALQVLSQLSPLRHYTEALLGIFLKGTGFATLWPHLVAMLGLGGGLFALGAVLFQRRLS
jgi:ABC-2 type transport system permease protein